MALVPCCDTRKPEAKHIRMHSYIGTVPPLDARAWMAVRDDVSGPVHPMSIDQEHFDRKDFVPPLLPHPPRWPNSTEIRDLVLDSASSTLSPQFRRMMVNFANPTQIWMEERLRYMQSLVHKESPTISKTIADWAEVGVVLTLCKFVCVCVCIFVIKSVNARVCQVWKACM